MPFVMLLVLKSTVLLGCAWIGSRLLGRASASVLHLLWIVAIAGVLLLPVAAPVTARWGVAVPMAAGPAPGGRDGVAGRASACGAATRTRACPAIRSADAGLVPIDVRGLLVPSTDVAGGPGIAHGAGAVMRRRGAAAWPLGSGLRDP